MYDNIIKNIVENNFYAPSLKRTAQSGNLSAMLMDIYENPQRYLASGRPENEVINEMPVINNANREKLIPSEWAMRYRRIKGKQLSFEKHKYQIPIINDMSPKIVVEKGAQLGLSEIMLTKIFWWADYREGRANIIYTFPTFNDMCTYATARVQPIITDAMPITENDLGFLPQYLEEEKTYIETMMNLNSSQIKKIRDTYVFFKGTISDRNAISVDSDWNIHDEVNFSDQGTLNKFRSRIGAETSMGWEYNFSTPTIPGYGVSDIYNKSDQKRWYITCPHCGKTQHMEFETHVVERTKKNVRDKQEYYYKCDNPRCNREITQETIINGKFIAEYPENKDISGYHIDKMLVKSANKLIESKEGYRRLADSYNFDLGRSYAEKTISLTEEIIRNCMSSIFKMWSSAKPEDRTVLGCDQGDTVWVIISRKNPFTSKRQIIYMEEIDEKECPNNDPFERVDELIERFNVQTAVIDMNPNKNSVRKLRNKYMGRVFMATYANFKGEILSFNEKDMVANIDRTEYFKETFNHIYTGQVEIPDNTIIGEKLIEHLTNVKKEASKNDETSEIKEWFKAIGPDHMAHTNLYNEVAYEYEYGKGNGAEKSMAMPTNPHWLSKGQNNNGWLKEVKKIPFQTFNRIR